MALRSCPTNVHALPKGSFFVDKQGFLAVNNVEEADVVRLTQVPVSLGLHEGINEQDITAVARGIAEDCLTRSVKEGYTRYAVTSFLLAHGGKGKTVEEKIIIAAKRLFQKGSDCDRVVEHLKHIKKHTVTAGMAAVQQDLGSCLRWGTLAFFGFLWF